MVTIGNLYQCRGYCKKYNVAEGDTFRVIEIKNDSTIVLEPVDSMIDENITFDSESELRRENFEFIEKNSIVGM